jgi:hypothetical protein
MTRSVSRNLTNFGVGSETRDAFERIERGDAGRRAMFAAIAWGARLELYHSQGHQNLLIEALGTPPQVLSRAIARLTGTDDWTR